MAFFEEKDDCVVLTVRTMPRASKDGIQGVVGEALKIRIQAPPIEGKANAYLVKFLSKQWNIPRVNFEILSGKTARQKRIRISNPSDDLKAILTSLAKQ